MQRRVLLVESHDGLRRVLGSFLSRNFEVVGAKHGLEAMAWLAKGVNPDIIVMGARMPEMGGAQLLSNLRCSGLWADIPVVVLSGTEDADEEHRFKAMGAYDYFPKPFDPLRLQDRLTQIVG
jgi:CheY-like chemotaxis protein